MAGLEATEPNAAADGGRDSGFAEFPVSAPGRYPGTLPHVAAELNAEGTDYLLLPDGPPETADAAGLATLRQLLSRSPAPLTRQEILARWPEPHPQHPDSLWRSLARGCELGHLVRTGAGTKAEGFRYGLAEGGNRRGRETVRRPGPSASSRFNVNPENALRLDRALLPARIHPVSGES